MESFVRNESDMMKLYVSSQPKHRSLYNINHGDTIVSIPIYVRPVRKSSHFAGAGMSRTLEYMVVGIYDENRIETMTPSNLVIIRIRVSWV